MKFHEFINKYINRKIDFDNAYGAQCVDVFRQYCKDVLNIPHTGAVEGAKDLFLNYDKLPLEKKYFKKVENINYGDIVIWNSTKKNPYGHIAIAISSTPSEIIVFEQNGFTQEGALINSRTKDNLLGILRFRSSL